MLQRMQSLENAHVSRASRMRANGPEARVLALFVLRGSWGASLFSKPHPKLLFNIIFTILAVYW